MSRRDQADMEATEQAAKDVIEQERRGKWGDNPPIPYFEIPEGGKYPDEAVFSCDVNHDWDRENCACALRCPRCGKVRKFHREHVKFDEKIEHARLICEQCGKTAAEFTVRIGEYSRRP